MRTAIRMQSSLARRGFDTRLNEPYSGDLDGITSALTARVHRSSLCGDYARDQPSANDGEWVAPMAELVGGSNRKNASPIDRCLPMAGFHFSGAAASRPLPIAYFRIGVLSVRVRKHRATASPFAAAQRATLSYRS